MDGQYINIIYAVTGIICGFIIGLIWAFRSNNKLSKHILELQDRITELKEEKETVETSLNQVQLQNANNLDIITALQYSLSSSSNYDVYLHSVRPLQQRIAELEKIISDEQYNYKWALERMTQMEINFDKERQNWFLYNH